MCIKDVRTDITVLRMRVNVAIYSLTVNAILIVKIVRCFYES